MLSVFIGVLRRDMRLVFRQRGVVVHQLLFSILVVVLFPLGTAADSTMLVTISPALLWIAVLLASLLSLQRLFRPDYENGTLEQFVLSPEPLAIIALGRVTAQWLSSGLVFVFISPLLAVLLGVPADAIPVIMCSLLLGTPTLGFIGAIGTALTLSLPRAGLLLSLLIFPLYVPVLIFGAGAMRAAIAGLPYAGPLYLLAALFTLSLTLAPWAIAAALRISLE